MDNVQSDFSKTARELLERHISEGAERDHQPAEAEAVRPKNINYAQRGNAGFHFGAMDIQQPAADKMNNRRNAEYFEHMRQSQHQRVDAREALEQHIDKNKAVEGRNVDDRSSPAREALEQHLKGVAQEVTNRSIDPQQHQRNGDEHER